MLYTLYHHISSENCGGLEEGTGPSGFESGSFGSGDLYITEACFGNWWRAETWTWISWRNILYDNQVCSV